MKRILLLALALLVTHAHARNYNDRILTWSCPVERVDGTPFNCTTKAAGYDLEVTIGTVVTVREIPPSATSSVITTDPSGTTYRLRVCDTAGECSAWTASVKKPGPPKPPSVLMN